MGVLTEGRQRRAEGSILGSIWGIPHIGALLVQPVLERVERATIGERLTSDAVTARIQQIPVHEAELAVAAIQKAERLKGIPDADDPEELREYGTGRLDTILVGVAGNSKVPPAVRKEVLEIAREAAKNADFKPAATTFVSEETRELAAALIDEGAAQPI